MRTAKIERNTKETQIALIWNTDGQGIYEGTCGIGFLDHMLQALCVHGKFDIQLSMKGDLEVDCHHSTEDLGIVLGMALAKALEEKGGIRRYGTAYIPMDETLGFCSLDISGRAFLVYEAEYENQSIGALDCCMIKEFFRALAFQAGITLHMKILYGENDHHKAESPFQSICSCIERRCNRNRRRCSFFKRSVVMIAIIDYGAGNLFSVKNALDYLQIENCVTEKAEIIRRADGLILPGVGAFPDAMERLERKQLVSVIQEEAARKPLLGICLGMQLLFEESWEFKKTKGLGLIPGKVIKIDGKGEKIPHMGWNHLEVLKPCSMTEGMEENSYVYFVHSYRADTEPEYLSCTTFYGEEIPALVQKDMVYGAQFHPEKSGSVGLNMLKNFARLVEK